MKHLLLLLCLSACNLVFTQTASDLFTKSETKITWLGIDFSHVKLIGSFAQFAEAGQTGPNIIKDKYFDEWNDLILNEYSKYNIGEMLRKEDIALKTSAISKINATTSTEEMESEEEPEYTKEDIEGFIKGYDLGKKEGIGLLLVAESLNKIREEGRYHFVAINLENNEVLLYDFFVTKPGGFGLRNYWAKTYYDVIVSIRDVKYKSWKKTYSN